MTVADIPVQERQDRLRGRVAGLRSKAAGSVPRERALLVVGGVLLPLGVLLVLVGWLGVARTPLVFEQVPYVVSGGMLGLAVVVIGGFVYFSYWQTLVVKALRDNQSELGATLLRIEALMAEQRSATAAPGDGTAVVPAQPGPRSGGSALVATASGTMLHRPQCAVVAGRESLREVTAETRGLTPCSLCQPLDA